MGTAISLIVGGTNPPGGLPIGKVAGFSCLFWQSICRGPSQSFRFAPKLCAQDLLHHHRCCDLGMRPLVDLTFFVNVQSENNFDHSLIEKPEHLLIWICEKAGSETPRNGIAFKA